MSKNLLFFLLGGGIFFLFILFSYLVHEDIFIQLDFNTTVRLQDNLPRRVDPFFSWFSFFGNFEVTIIFLGLLLLALRRIWAGLVTFFLFGMFHVIELFGKYMVDHPPPPQFMLRTEHQVPFEPFHIRAEFSYPSGHSGRTVFIATLLIFLVYKSSFPLAVKVFLLSIIVGYTVIMLFSRIYLGEHWMTDVVGGSLLALSFSFVCLAFYASQGQKKNGLKETSL